MSEGEGSFEDPESVLSRFVCSKEGGPEICAGLLRVASAGVGSWTPRCMAVCMTMEDVEAM